MTAFQHEAVVVASEEQFLAVAVPFVEEGLLAGEGVVTRLEARRHRLVEDALGRQILAVPVAELDAPGALRSHRQAFERLLAAGTPRIRVLGEDPAVEPGGDAWGYYEVLSNRLYADLPLWSLCAHDVRRAERRIELDVRRCHPVIRTLAGEVVRNLDYVEPALEQASRTAAALRVDELRLPRLELVSPTAAQTRRAMRDLVGRVGLEGGTADGLVLGASEVVENAWSHGVPPVTLRAWAAPGRLVVAVTDTGPGPADPLFDVGRRPERSGMWLACQLCELGTWNDPDRGFTVRLEARAQGASET